CGFDEPGARLIKGLPQIQSVRDWIEQSLGRNIRFRWMQSRRELNVVHGKISGEVEPLFNGAVGIGIPYGARRQFLQGGCQDANFHKFWIERFDRHSQQLTKFTASSGIVATDLCLRYCPGITHEWRTDDKTQFISRTGRSRLCRYDDGSSRSTTGWRWSGWRGRRPRSGATGSHTGIQG